MKRTSTPRGLDSVRKVSCPLLLPGLLLCYDNYRNTAMTDSRIVPELVSRYNDSIRPAADIAVNTLITFSPAIRGFGSICALIPGGYPLSDHFRPGRPGRQAPRQSWLVPWALPLAIAALLSACGTAGSPGQPAAGAAPVTPASAAPVLPRPVSAARLARLPAATTFGRLHSAPRDPDPFAPERGTVLHPAVTRVVYARPGGPPVAALPATELGSPTWVPVVQ